MLTSDIIVFDFETGGIDPYTCPPIQIAAKAINIQTLEPYTNGEFESMMCPEDPENISNEALKVNKKSMDEVLAAPKASDVWNDFISYVGKYNKTGKLWNAPIAAGHNIAGYDMIIVKRMNQLYNKKNKPVFHPQMMFDNLHINAWWHERSKDIYKFNQKYLAEKHNLLTASESEDLHDALTDVRVAAKLTIKYLKLHREINKRIGWPWKPAIAT